MGEKSKVKVKVSRRGKSLLLLLRLPQQFPVFKGNADHYV